MTLAMLNQHFWMWALAFVCLIFVSIASCQSAFRFSMNWHVRGSCSLERRGLGLQAMTAIVNSKIDEISSIGMRRLFASGQVAFPSSISASSPTRSVSEYGPRSRLGECNAVITIADHPQTAKWRATKGGLVVIPKKSAYMSSDDVAKWLGYSVRAITLWAEQWHETGGQQGTPGFKVGRAWRFDSDELQRWLDAKKISYQQVPSMKKSG